MITRIIKRFFRWFTGVSSVTWLRIASVMTLFALALMVWSLFDPTIIPIIVGMSLAQVFGTISFAIYGVIVFLDVTRKRRAKRESLREIPRL